MRRLVLAMAAVLVCAATLEAEEQRDATIEVRVLDAAGKAVVRGTSDPLDGTVTLRFRRVYEKGDRIQVQGPAHMVVRLDNTMAEALVYCPKRGFEFTIPFDAAAKAHNKFSEERHEIRARTLVRGETAQYRNLALNPYDLATEVATTGLFPHASTNSVCRNEPVFAARNAIDGVAQSKGHGGWPRQSWGPDMREDLWWRLDFGRSVEVDKLCVVLRADVPHDGFFESARLVFSDGTFMLIKFQPMGDRQEFGFPPKTVTWLELRDIVLPKPPRWCAVTEIEAGGREASGYAKKATWRETIASQFGIGPSYVITRAMQDFPEAREELEIVGDWVGQDKLDEQRDISWTPNRVEKYLKDCEVRRETRLRLHRDRLARIIFTKHYDMGGSHYAYTEGQSDAQAERHFVPGASLCLLEMEGTRGKVRTLIDDPNGVIRDPDVSFDGKRVLFAWKKSLNEDDYHLYEMNMEDGRARQLTFGLGFADYEGAYLPNGDIIFNSTRCVQTVDCWWTEVSNIFTCDRDGRYLRRLGYDQVHTNFPTVTPDGRVIYTRWDYNDRGQIYPQGLFKMNPDGTGQTAVYGNNSWFPTTILHARAIPGTSKIVCIFTGHHSRQKGWLGIIDPAKGHEENMGAQLIAPVRKTEAVHVDAYGQQGDQFQYPYPLSETEYLVAFKPVGAPRFGIYFVTMDGQRELLVSDPKISCNQPIPLAPRPLPHVMPNLVDYRKDKGVCYVQDVYAGLGLQGVPRGTIKALRVVTMEFRAAGIGSNGNSGPAGGAMASTPVSIQGAWDPKIVLGTAKVYEDGSACFTVPARIPVYFQALDAKGRMVQTMRSWATLMPGEHFSCVGCHENKNTAPLVGKVTQALAAGPQELTPWHGKPRGFSFIREIQPILDKHCVRCHYLDTPPPGAGAQAAGEEFDPEKMRVILAAPDAGWRYTVEKPGDDWTQACFDDSKWVSGPGGFGRKGTPGAKVGTDWGTKEIWLRKTFDLKPDAKPAAPAFLVHHDEDVEIYVNGVLAGKAVGYLVRYMVMPMTPEGARALVPGKNTLAVHCRQTTGGQYIDVGMVDTQTKPVPVAKQDKKAAFSLKGTQTLEPRSLRKWSDAYKNLANRNFADWINIQSEPSMLPPYHAGAGKSRVITMLEEGHGGAKLSTEEIDTVACWIDLLVPYCGDYTEAMDEKQIPKYQHFLEKRRRWEEQEARNIADYLQSR